MDTHDRCPRCFAPTTTLPCAACGWRPGQDNEPPALPLGLVLHDCYRLGRVLGHGGFGITYLAWDDNLALPVAIKEFLPLGLASRGPDRTTVAVRGGEAREQFADGLEQFMEEARRFARFREHPGIVDVITFFRAHGTGYMVMAYIDGITLKDWLARQPGGRAPFDRTHAPAWVRRSSRSSGPLPATGRWSVRVCIPTLERGNDRTPARGSMPGSRGCWRWTAPGGPGDAFPRGAARPGGVPTRRDCPNIQALSRRCGVRPQSLPPPPVAG